MHDLLTPGSDDSVCTGGDRLSVPVAKLRYISMLYTGAQRHVFTSFRRVGTSHRHFEVADWMSGEGIPAQQDRDQGVEERGDWLLRTSSALTLSINIVCVWLVN